MTREQEEAVRKIAEEGAKTNEEMLKQRFPPQVSAPEAKNRKGDMKATRPGSE